MHSGSQGVCQSLAILMRVLGKNFLPKKKFLDKLQTEIPRFIGSVSSYSQLAKIN